MSAEQCVPLSLFLSPGLWCKGLTPLSLSSSLSLSFFFRSLLSRACFPSFFRQGRGGWLSGSLSLCVSLCLFFHTLSFLLARSLACWGSLSLSFCPPLRTQARTGQLGLALSLSLSFFIPFKNFHNGWGSGVTPPLARVRPTLLRVPTFQRQIGLQQDSKQPNTCMHITLLYSGVRSCPQCSQRKCQIYICVNYVCVYIHIYMYIPHNSAVINLSVQIAFPLEAPTSSFWLGLTSRDQALLQRRRTASAPKSSTHSSNIHEDMTYSTRAQKQQIVAPQEAVACQLWSHHLSGE